MKKLIFIITLVAPCTLGAHNSFMSYRTFVAGIDRDLKGLSENSRKERLMMMIHEAESKIKGDQKDILAKQNMVYAYNYLRQSLGLKTAPSFYEIDHTWLTEQTISRADEAQKAEFNKPVITTTKPQETPAAVTISPWVVPAAIAAAALGMMGVIAWSCKMPRKAKKA